MESVHGELMMYEAAKRLVAFVWDRSEEATRTDGFAVFLGGLSDGLLCCSYLMKLAEHLSATCQLQLVQPVLSSSYTGYGTSSLRQDAQEMRVLLRKLRERNPHCKLVLIGHSTGCQDVVQYMRQEGAGLPVDACVLQAPISDRLCMESQDHRYPQAMLAARQLVDEGRPQELLAATLHEVPITAYRYLSLGGRMTDDDLFSADLTDDELKQQLGHMSAVPSLWLFSGDDDYLPGDGSVDQQELGRRIGRVLAAAAGPDSPALFRACVIAGANHSLDSSPDHKASFFQLVAAFLHDAFASPAGD